jgi:hypothetical protein
VAQSFFSSIITSISSNVITIFLVLLLNTYASSSNLLEMWSIFLTIFLRLSDPLRWWRWWWWWCDFVCFGFCFWMLSGAHGCWITLRRSIPQMDEGWAVSPPIACQLPLRNQQESFLLLIFSWAQVWDDSRISLSETCHIHDTQAILPFSYNPCPCCL